MSAAHSPETSQQLNGTTQRNKNEDNKFKRKSSVIINCLQREIWLTAKFNSHQIHGIAVMELLSIKTIT